MLKLMKVLYDCGAITGEEIDSLGLDWGIVNDLVSKEQLVATMVDGKQVYLLTEFGEKVYRLNTGSKIFFRCTNKSKMASLVKFYASLSDEERDTWKSKDVWYTEGFVGAIPDATYMKDGEMHGVYVCTPATSKDLIANVEAFVKERNIPHMEYLR